MMHVETERARIRRERRERLKFMKRAMNFDVHDDAERESIVESLKDAFSDIKVHTFGTVISYQPGENTRFLIFYYLLGWFSARGQKIVWIDP
jgi:ribosomal protein L23